MWLLQTFSNYLRDQWQGWWKQWGSGIIGMGINGSGWFGAVDLPPGSYHLTASALGYLPDSKSEVLVSPGRRFEVEFLLAGQLLRWGFVEAPECPYDGLLANGTASQCGVEATRAEVETWQNRFDERIYQVAQRTGLSVSLLSQVERAESAASVASLPIAAPAPTRSTVSTRPAGRA